MFLDRHLEVCLGWNCWAASCGLVISHMRTADVARFVVATARLLYPGSGWALFVNWGWVGIGMMGTGNDGIATPDRTRLESDAEHKLSPAILVVAAFVCAMAAAVMGSMLSDPTASVTDYSAGMTGSGLPAEELSQHH